MSTITLPPMPRTVPALTVDPAAIRESGGQLLAASAQIDDLGTFVAGDARVGDWTGVGSTAYHQAITPIGRRADAMSLALRGVARRVDSHADEMTDLEVTHDSLDERRRHLAQQIALLRAEAATAKPDEVAGLQAQCDGVTREVEVYETDLSTWVSDLATEETEMKAAFDRVMALGQVEDHYGGVADPADDALATKPPGGASPAEVNEWWDGLTEEQRQAVIAAAPGSVGNLDGIPATDRDAANTVALDRDLADWGAAEDAGVITDEERTWLENARAAQEAIDRIEGRDDPLTGEPIETQVYTYDPYAFDGDGAIAISAGNLDTADNVSVVVPGLGTDAESAGYHADRAATIYESTRYLDGSQSNATMFWIGYDAPDNVPWDEGFDITGVVREDMAEAGGERLADTIDGLRESRDGEPAHLSVIGHSYGSTTTGHGLGGEGMDVDDVVFVGSPGVGGDNDNVDDLGVDPDHVWAGANSFDPVADLGNHGAVHGETLGGLGMGDDPVEDDFGANRFEAESSYHTANPFADHSKYFDHDTESLYNISQIVNGNYDAVYEADHVHDPWFGGPEDPEADRDARDPGETRTQRQ